MNYKRKSNEQIGGAQASEDRRTVVLDIETVALDPNDEKGALDAMTGRVVCISMLVDDGKAAEEITVTTFWILTSAFCSSAAGFWAFSLAALWTRAGTTRRM